MSNILSPTSPKFNSVCLKARSCTSHMLSCDFASHQPSTLISQVWGPLRYMDLSVYKNEVGKVTGDQTGQVCVVLLAVSEEDTTNLGWGF